MKKISIGKSVAEQDFTFDDRKGEICFGLHERGKPSTLISPRPRIEVKRIKDGKEVIEDEQQDDEDAEESDEDNEDSNEEEEEEEEEN